MRQCKRCLVVFVCSAPLSLAACKKTEPAGTAAPPQVAPGGLKVEGIVKSALPEKLPKPAAEGALLKTKVTSDAGPVDGTVQVRLFKPGADLEESKALVTGWSNTNLKAPPGTYDLLLRYKESDVANATGWVRGVELAAGQLLRLKIGIDYPVGRLKLVAMSQGQDVGGKTRVSVYKPGADAEESKPLLSVWAGQVLALPAGKYDVRVVYQESAATKAEQWLRGLEIPGKRELRRETVTLDLAVSFVKVTATNFGADLGGGARVALFKAGAAPGEAKPLFEGWTGSVLPVPAATYDVRVRYEPAAHAKAEAWKKGLVVAGKRDSVVEKVELNFALGRVTVKATRADKELGGRARVELFAADRAGEGQRPVATGWSGAAIIVPAAAYDLKVSLDKTVAWDKGVKVEHAATVARSVALP